MRSFAIEEPGSPVPALYATLSSVKTVIFKSCFKVNYVKHHYRALLSLFLRGLMLKNITELIHNHHFYLHRLLICSWRAKGRLTNVTQGTSPSSSSPSSPSSSSSPSSPSVSSSWWSNCGAAVYNSRPLQLLVSLLQQKLWAQTIRSNNQKTSLKKLMKWPYKNKNITTSENKKKGALGMTLTHDK